MKMKPSRNGNPGAWILCALMFLISLAVWPHLPEQIPLHFNAAGSVDGTGPRFMIFMFPVLTAFLLLVAEVSPRIDPRQDNYRRFRQQYRQLHFILSLLFLLIELYTIAICFRPGLTETLSIGTWMPALIGALLAFCGNAMPKFKYNFFVGVKTPWTLADENVWYLTHRFSGKVFVVCGVLMMLAAFLPPDGKVLLFLLLIAAMILLPTLYSYLAFRRQKAAGCPADAEEESDQNEP